MLTSVYVTLPMLTILMLNKMTVLDVVVIDIWVLTRTHVSLATCGLWLITCLICIWSGPALVVTMAIYKRNNNNRMYTLYCPARWKRFFRCVFFHLLWNALRQQACINLWYKSGAYCNMYFWLWKILVYMKLYSILYFIKIVF